MFKIEYYKESEKYPVMDFISSLPTKDKAKILWELDMLEEFGTMLGMPYIKKIKGTEELWELRIKHNSKNYRIFYFNYSKGILVLIHALQKKSSQTPRREIKLALSRLYRYRERR